jgi:hypothetical protein
MLTILLLVIGISGVVQAQTWFDPNWDYRIPVEVDNTGNSEALTNYQLRVDLDALNFDFSAAQSGGEDIRFTEADGSTLIDHWIEDWDAVGESATIWVEVPSVAALSTADIYLYYGNSMAADSSDGTATFEFFDDFETDYIGSSGWTSKAGIPQAKSDVSAATYDNKFYVFGGYDRDASCVKLYLDEAYAYDPSTDAWTQLADMPTARWGQASVECSGVIHVFGGDASTGPTDVHEIYDPSTDTWTTGTPVPSTIANQGLMAIKYGSKIHLFYKQYHYEYDPVADTYTAKANVPTPRTWGSCALVNDNIYVIGGYSYGTPGGASTVNEVYDPATDTWTNKAALPVAKYGITRENPVINGKIYLSHGIDGGFRLDIHEYDPSTDTWTQKSDGMNARNGIGCGVIDNKLYIACGRNLLSCATGLTYVEEYDPASDQGTGFNPWTVSDPSMIYRDPSAQYEGGYGLLFDKPSSSGEGTAEHFHDYTTCAVDIYWNITDDYTIDDVQPQGVFGLTGTVSNGHLYYYNDGGSANFRWYTGSFSTLQTGAWDSWFPITIIWDGANSKVIIDGTEHAVSAASTNSDRIFFRINKSTKYFVDLVRVRKYTADEPSLSFGSVESSAPDVPVLIAPADLAIINDATPEFEWSNTIEPGGTYTLEYSTTSDFSSSVYTETDLTTNTFTPSTPLSPDGTWYWHIEAFSPSGLNGSGYQDTPFSFTLDTDPPDIPTLLTPNDAVFVNTDTPEFTWSATAGTGGDYTLEYSQDVNFVTGVTTVTDIAGESHTPSSALVQGLWYWRVEAFDQAGNASGYQTPFSFTVDTDPPDLPALLTPADGDFINDDTPEFTWSATAGAGGEYTLEYSQDENFVSGVVSVTDITGESHTPSSALAQGLWYWRVEAFDQAGNGSGYQTPFSFTLDTDPPDIPTLLTPADGIYVTTETPEFTWSATAGTNGSYTLEYSQDAGFSSGVTTVSDISSENYTPSSPLSQGLWYWRVEAFDQAGNGSGFQATPFSFDLDSESPDPPDLLTPPDGSTTNDNTPEFTWSATAGAGGQYTLQYSKHADFGSNVVTIAGMFSTSFSPSSGMSDGTWFWRVEAKDEAGNVSGYQTPFSVTIDTQDPNIPGPITPSNGSYIYTDIPEFSWIATAGSGGTYTLEYSQDQTFASGVTTITDLADANYTPSSALAQGTWYWRVEAIDFAGNGSGFYSPPYSFTIDQIPPEAPSNFVAEPGHEKCKLTWVNPTGDPSFAGVEIRRHPWAIGAYPEYDDDYPTPTGYPASHTEGELVYSGPLESFIDSAGVGEWPRNVYYYSIFAYDEAGNYSATAGTDQQGHATNYWLGDVTGDGSVYYEDLTLLSITYWLTDGSSGYNSEFDIGPTQTGSSLGVPMTDNVINFEDLIIFASNYAELGPNTKINPELPQTEISGPLGLSLEFIDAQNKSAGDEVQLSVILDNNPDQVKGFNFCISYDNHKLEFIEIVRSESLERHTANAFFAGRQYDDQVEVSLAALGRGTSIKGSGQISILKFRMLDNYIPGFEFTDVTMRDVNNDELLAVKNGIAGIIGNRIPESFVLGQNYPNPFNMQTEIYYELSNSSYVELDIYNILGQRIRQLVSEHKDAGVYQVSWDGRDETGREVASGIYLYRLSAGSFIETKKMNILK